MNLMDAATLTEGEIDDLSLTDIGNGRWRGLADAARDKALWAVVAILEDEHANMTGVAEEWMWGHGHAISTIDAELRAAGIPRTATT